MCVNLKLMSKCLRWAAAGKGNIPDRPSATSEQWGNRGQGGGEELGYVDLARTLTLFDSRDVRPVGVFGV